MKAAHVGWMLATVLLVGGSRAGAAGPEVAIAGGACDPVLSGETRRLTGDLACGTLALESGATLDLGGHTLDAFVEASGSGVRLTNGAVVGQLDFVSCVDCVVERVHVRDGDDFVLMAGPRLLVAQSRFTGNDVAIDIYYAAGGVRIVDSVFEDNRVGVNIAWPSENVVSSSTFRRNRVGVNVWDEDGEGVNDNAVEDNLFEDNQLGAVLYVGCQDTPCHEGNRFVRNWFHENRGSGLLVEATLCAESGTECDDVEALVWDNEFSRNGSHPTPDLSPDGLDQRNSDDGLTVVGPAHATDGITVTANHALENAALGIDAVGVTDGGGNRAGGNGDPRQCVGVECDRAVAIDVRPGSDANPINPRARGVVTVAILGAADFDVADVDASTLLFGPAGAPPARETGRQSADLNRDGASDLLSHYRIAQTGIRAGETRACVAGRTRDGTAFRGCDAIRTGR